MTRRVIGRMPQQPTLKLDDQARLDEFTPQSGRCLNSWLRALSNREINVALAVEESTVRTHVERILMKLDLRDRVRL